MKRCRATNKADSSLVGISSGRRADAARNIPEAVDRLLWRRSVQIQREHLPAILREGRGRTARWMNAIHRDPEPAQTPHDPECAVMLHLQHQHGQ